MNRRWIVLAALCTVACQTHQVEECFPPCGASDQTFFARCVADGLPGDCEPGNRRCCALATECIGDLDDQHVVTTQTDCRFVTEDACFPPCDLSSEQNYELCISTGMTMTGICPPGDEECCALSVDCLGTLGDVLVTADGCCATVDDCLSGERCDSTFTCVPSTGCGDGDIAATEECDDGNDETETCDYGAASCVVCAAGCVEEEGVPRFCGDGAIDIDDGEQCDPPDGELCGDTCHPIAASSCTNSIMDGTETAPDCGGDACPPCPPGSPCRAHTDCAQSGTMCGITLCGSTRTCTENFVCDDGDACTEGLCMTGAGCMFFDIDRDGDTFGPLDLGCGEDCDDTNPRISPAEPEICDGIDQNCTNGLVDEPC